MFSTVQMKCRSYTLWPTGITKPQHYWPFALTGNYSDQGATGGLTLAAGGTGNSFNANGLNFDGNGWASTTGNADVLGLGTVFSVVAKYYISDLTVIRNIMANGQVGVWTDGFWLGINTKGGCEIFNGGTEDLLVYTVLDAPGSSMLVATFDTGTMKVYLGNRDNSDAPIGSAAASGTSAGPLYVGWDGSGNKLPAGSYLSFVGILKGTAWTPAEVATIYAALQ